MNAPSTRLATAADIDDLLRIERQCFTSDRLSRRSFQRLIRHGHASLLLAFHDTLPAGYALVLYRRGTRLARLYSLAVLPELRGQGVAQRLLDDSEQAAREQNCIFMRLEVNVHNQAAIALYRRAGYHAIGTIRAYYEDGGDALKMEKPIRRQGGIAPERRTAFYEQTTPFSCGPASLMMGMHHLDPGYRMSRREELKIWRESTTIFMTAGHGGCSPQGLALSAWRRGFAVTLYCNATQVPFIDSVRDPDKKQVIALVHEDFTEQLADSDVDIQNQEMTPEQLQRHIARGDVLISLISTWRLNRNKAPHWVMITAADERFVYLTDPDRERDEYQSETDYIDVPVEVGEFLAMAAFGRSRLKSTLALSLRSTL
ncbi:GNAT family N-acetyltransferase [Marinobacterium nitratireducens]|uniref:GNAT family N-acetyltransferase n=1 Tax=Marinobacterium nitratireducens TaxID=518897 RepID=A0A917ZMS2_9GAMM|nr:GNAT family N-acetyltransferase/peptidase C39 family protein [Marinobacterium nitratireducens]GGO85828.1 GNAT family N-acetyltransferase [Marinobacterium nitratireducens]